MRRGRVSPWESFLALPIFLSNLLHPKDYRPLEKEGYYWVAGGAGGAWSCPGLSNGDLPPSHKGCSQDIALLPLLIPRPKAALATAMLLASAPLQGFLCAPFFEEDFWAGRCLGWSQELRREENG